VLSININTSLAASNITGYGDVEIGSCLNFGYIQDQNWSYQSQVHFSTDYYHYFLYGLGFGTSYNFGLFSNKGYISAASSVHYPKYLSSNEFRPNIFFILGYETGICFYKNLYIIFKGYYNPLYSVNDCYVGYDMVYNSVNFKIKFRKFYDKSKHWSIGWYYGITKFKAENVFENTYKHIKKNLYLNIIKGIFIEF